MILLTLLGLAVGGLQALALFILGNIHKELRELAGRLDALERDYYARRR